MAQPGADRDPPEFNFKGLGSQSSNEFEIVHNEISDDEEGRRGDPVPAAIFPGTWEAAKLQSIEVGKKVADATYSYAGQIAQSGIVDLGKTTGQALANTANRQALNAVQGTLNRAGLSRADLPKPLQNWLQTKHRIDDYKAKASEALKTREARNWKKHLVKTGQVVEARASRQAFSPAPSVFESEISTVERGADGSVHRTTVSRRTSTTSRTAPEPSLDTALNYGGFNASADAGFVSQFVNSEGSTPWRDQGNNIPLSPGPQHYRTGSWARQSPQANTHSQSGPISPIISSPGRRGSLLKEIPDAMSTALNGACPVHTARSSLSSVVGEDSDDAGKGSK